MQHVDGKRRGQRFPGKQAYLFTELNHQPQISDTKRHNTHESASRRPHFFQRLGVEFICSESCNVKEPTNQMNKQKNKTAIKVWF